MNARAPITNLPEKLRLRAEDFELLEASGAFEAFSKAELLDGDIYIVNAQYARHGIAKVELLYALMTQLREMGSDLNVYSEVSLRVAADSMPEPDLFIAPRQGYGPVPVEGVLLVVEVADSTLATDVGRKAELYAAAGIPEYWVVDVDAQRILKHASPSTHGYATRTETPFCEPLASTAIEGLEVATDRLLG